MSFQVAFKLSIGGADEVRGGFRKVAEAAEDAGNRANAGFGKARAGVQSISEQLNTLRQQVGGLVLGAFAQDLIRQANTAEMTLQKLQQTMKFASASAQDLAANQAFLAERVRSLGLDLASAGDQFAKLQAAARGTALEGAGARSVFDAVAQASTVMGVSAQETGGALNALQQMISKGTVSAEELRGQLGERLPGAFQVAARAMGVTTEELGKMLEKGQLTAEVFLPRFAAQMRTEMAGSVEEASTSVRANLGRVQSGWTQLLATINNSQISNEVLKGLDAGLTGLRKAMEDTADDSPKFADTLAQAMGLAADAVSGLWASMRGVKAEFEGIAASARNYLERQAALMALGSGMGGKGRTAADVNAEFDARQKAINEGYERDVASIYSGLGKFRKAVEEEIAARDDRRRRLGLDMRSRGAVRDRDGIQAFEDEQLLATTPQLGAATQQSKQFEAETRRLADLTAEASGFTRTFAEDVRILQKVRDGSAASEKRYGELLDALLAKQPGVKDMMDERKKGLEGEAKAALESIKRYDEAEQAADARLKTAGDMLKAIQRETAAIGMSNEERQISNALLELEAKGIKAGTEAYEEYAQKIEAAIRQRSAAQQGQRNAGLAVAEWKRASDDIERALTDALMRGFESGRGFLDSLVSTIKSAFQSMVVRVVVQPVMGSMSSFLGMPAQAGQMAGQAPGAGAGGPLGSFLGSAGMAAMGGFFKAGSIAGSASFANGFSALQGSGSLMAGGQVANGASLGAGSIAGMVGPALIGQMVGRAISDGYSVGGSSSRAVNVGTAVGAFFGPIGAGIGAAIGGAVNRLFGRRAQEVTASGVTGTVSSDGFSGEAYSDWLRKGGTFRSDKRGRDMSAVGTELQQTLDMSIGMLYGATEGYAEALGLPVQTVRNFSGQFAVAWGKTEEENKAALEKALGGLQNQLAGVYAAQLAPLQRAGETMSQTLERLAGLQQFSASLAELGTVFGRVANLAVDAREQMIELAGGMEVFSGNALGFIQNYYSRDEIAGFKARELQGVFSGLGITQQFTGADAAGQFRALVEGTDVSTEAGRRQLASLLGIQGDFAQVAPFLADMGISLSDAAAMAPEAGNLESLFSAAAQPQVTAINNGTTAVVGALNMVADVIRSNGGVAGSSLLNGTRSTVDEVVIVDEGGNAGGFGS